MEDKIEWMLTEATADGMNLTEDEIYFLLISDSDSVDSFSDAEVEYVRELDREWEAR